MAQPQEMTESVEFYQIPGEYRYKGVTYCDEIPLSSIKRIEEELELTSQDIVVASFPKSGTTWTLDILYWLSKGCKAGRERTENMDDIFLYVEAQFPGEPPILDTVMKQPSPHNLKTHLGADFYKKFLNNPSECPKFVVVMRDVRDCLVSNYHFMRLMYGEDFGFTFDDFLAMYYANRAVYGDIIEYNLGWWAYKDHPNVFIVHYEDMLQDAKSAVQSLGEFINRPVDEAIAAEIAEGCSFARMKERAVTYQKSEFDRDAFFRKGKKGDGKIYFSLHQAQHIENMVKEKCHPKGLYLNMYF